MSRAAKLFLAFVCIGQILGCAKLMWGEPKPGALPLSPPAVDTPSVTLPPALPRVNYIGVDSVTGAMFGVLRERMYGHTTLPDLESVMCLYGVVQQDTAYVLFMRPTASTPTATYVSYSSCPRIAADRFGPLRYLGTWHNHNPGNYRGLGVEQACWFSLIDQRTFEADLDAIIDMASCDRLMGRVWERK